MTIAELPFSKKKLLARKIRALVEPDGAASEGIIREIEIRRLIESEENIVIDGIADVVTILRSNYSEKTITRLISKIQKSVVWDTSICNLPTPKLTKLFYKDQKNNVITSLTFTELLKLSHNDKVYNSSKNAKYLLMCIADDINSKYSTCVQICKETYVDTQLIEYCSKNDYSLYTSDVLMGLRAKSNHVDVKIFHKHNTNVKTYIPSKDATSKNIILDVNLLKNVTIDDIIYTAKLVNGRKFILTHEFVECLETLKNAKYVDNYISFFLNDIDNSYSLYLNAFESSGTITELSKKYNAIIFTADIEQCFSFKTIYHTDFKLVLPSSDRTFIENIDQKCITTSNEAEEDKTQNSLKTTTIQTEKENATIYALPHYVHQFNSITTNKLPVNENIWVLDQNGNEVFPNSRKFIELSIDYTVIHGINHLTGNYELCVYHVLAKNKNNIGARIFYSIYHKDDVNSFEPKYKRFANKLVLMT